MPISHTAARSGKLWPNGFKVSMGSRLSRQADWQASDASQPSRNGLVTRLVLDSIVELSAERLCLKLERAGRALVVALVPLVGRQKAAN